MGDKIIQGIEAARAAIKVLLKGKTTSIALFAIIGIVAIFYFTLEISKTNSDYGILPLILCYVSVLKIFLVFLLALFMGA